MQQSEDKSGASGELNDSTMCETVLALIGADSITDPSRTYVWHVPPCGKLLWRLSVVGLSTHKQGEQLPVDIGIQSCTLYNIFHLHLPPPPVAYGTLQVRQAHSYCVRN